MGPSRAWGGGFWPRVRRRPGSVKLGGLRRLTPVTPNFGFSRGLPVDRVHIEAFLEYNALAIRGRVLEMGDDQYTRRFGGGRVTRSDVLDVRPGHPNATVIADLTAADHVPSNTFDCIICTQTLQLVFDLPAAVTTLYRILKPGGVLLLTVPGITSLDDPEWAPSWYWSFTTLSVRKLFERLFGPDDLEVGGDGNVLTAVAFLHGLVAEDLTRRELAYRDPSYPLIVSLRAVKSSRVEESGDRAGSASEPTVSVIISCFNQAHFLSDTIESALDQTHPAVEVVVVDDGSSDHTSEVAGRYGSLTYVQQPHAGLPAARNAGLQHSCGEYVIFLDAPDRLLPDAAAEGLSALAAHPECAFATGHHRRIDVDGSVAGEWTRPSFEKDRYALLLKGNYISICAAVLFRRAALDVVGGFDSRLPAAEDYELFLRMARRFPICDHDQVVAEYRQHGTSPGDDPLRMLYSVMRVLKAQKPFIGDNTIHAQAWRTGIEYWRTYYGKAAAERLTERLRDGHRIREVLPDAIALARLMPGVLGLAWRRLVLQVR